VCIYTAPVYGKKVVQLYFLKFKLLFFLIFLFYFDVKILIINFIN
jgi:hypothetical protein